MYLLKLKTLKRLLYPALSLAALCPGFTAAAQAPSSYEDFDRQYKDYRTVYSDTTDTDLPTRTEVVKETNQPFGVVTNKFGKNWFVFATAGAHTFRGDYSGRGKFGGTISPDFGIGVGKWFTPGVGVKLEFIRSDSKGYTEYLTGHYGYGGIMQAPDGTPYRKMRTRWWDIGASVIFNLSRLIYGYEGADSPKLMNQFMLNAGIGGVHHMGYGHSHGSDNELSAHLELQYSRFFTRSKRFSLDFKLRALLYQTNFDLEYGQANHAANKWDSNLGADLGFTFYLGSKRARSWRMGATHTYTRDYRERQIREVRVKEGDPAKFTEITFYVFYPNNYSGRNDAPTIASSSVNAIDYLTGGIYTQRRFEDNGDVASRLVAGRTLKGLPTEDLPTEPADRDFAITSVPRGYEMGEGPISLSLAPSDMSDFRQSAGFYYAPIYGDQHLWHYRIDDATRSQKLLSEDNYYETQTFGLNAHKGLETIREYFDIDRSEYLVSLADIYAAVKSNQGHIAKHADQETVDDIRHIIENGVITGILVEGLATSQDNFTGPDAKQVGLDRNTTLSDNRATTVLNWLRESGKFDGVDSKTYRVNSFKNAVRGIGRVDDPSTRGIEAKMNRCVKVHLQYILPQK
ncbi:hypothetical protein [Duncaniella muris]|uniref:OmpA-like domain-containing protein n=1 Tax=Duncaniella muris TaxID=2094150 RepID=A0A2V1ING8_9BACT|nr:hypothetical protein [Duncaniella muris]PWB01385.1 hypothetical protein C5O23_10025 [Duncaniella muris]